jgi:hypothetical protein
MISGKNFFTLVKKFSSKNIINKKSLIKNKGLSIRKHNHNHNQEENTKDPKETNDTNDSNNAINDLKNALNQEIIFENENYKEIDKKSYEEFLVKSNFIYKEEPNSTKLILTKTKDLFKITIYFNASPPLPKDNENKYVIKYGYHYKNEKENENENENSDSKKIIK